MKRSNRVMAAFGAIILAAVALVGAFSASATGGDQTNPLVTLSYLTQVVTPELMNKVNEQVAANEQELLDKVNSAIEDYSEKMEQAVGGNVAGSAAYVPVALKAGSMFCPAAGSEILLRTGTAKVASGVAPVMLNATSGVTVSIGGALQANNLYVIPLDGAVISATSDCTVLVRGVYTVV